jgi:glycerol-3-phosphate acyltransferase PlsY
VTPLGAGLVTLAYLLGGIPFGYLVVWRVLGKDVRTLGSGNIGATNVARIAGKKWGVLVLVLDAAKGFLPTLVSRLAAPEAAWLHVFTGGAAILGHIFPVYLKLRGGKGVATALGVYLVLLPVAGLAGALVFAVCYAAARVVSVGSLLGAMTSCAVAFATLGVGAYSLLSAGAAAMIVWRHRGNLVRLAQGREKPL